MTSECHSKLPLPQRKPDQAGLVFYGAIMKIKINHTCYTVDNQSGDNCAHCNSLLKLHKLKRYNNVRVHRSTCLERHLKAVESKVQKLGLKRGVDNLRFKLIKNVETPITNKWKSMFLDKNRKIWQKMELRDSLANSLYHYMNIDIWGFGLRDDEEMSIDTYTTPDLIEKLAILESNNLLVKERWLIK